MNNKRFGDNKRAFTLAEMMVVMLIMTIMLAAFAPLMTKKKSVDFNSNPWLFTQDSLGDIYYGLNGTQTAMIGQKQQADNDPESKLLINASDDSEYSIVFKDQGTFAGGLTLNKNGNLFLGKKDNNITTPPSGNNASNIAIGLNSLTANTTGSNNVSLGSLAMSANTSGSYNVAIGAGACGNVTTGSNKTCIGTNSGPTSTTVSTATDDSKVIFLGDASTTVYIPGRLQVGDKFAVDQSNVSWAFRIKARGSTYSTVDADINDNILRAYGDTSYSIDTSNYSDKRLKNIKGDNKSGLDKVRELKVFDYTFKNDKDKTPHVGVIAQDLQKVFPAAVKEDKKTGFLKIRHEDMFYAVVNAVKELDNFVQGIINELKVVYEKINNHDAQIKALQQENQELKARIDKLEKLIENK